MTATDELRALLDARGAEWARGLGSIVEWVGANERLCRAYARPEPLTVDVAMISVTPAQAVEATLGRGECRITVQDNLVETDGMGDVWLECDACHWQMPLEPSTPRFNYCPNCGRKVTND